MPEISVIVPVYKVEPYLNRCVDSMLAQTYADFELILVDDGSPDNCPAICDEYAIKDKRVRVIHQENGGLSAARNAGIDWAFANSDSKWLCFVDSDDWVHPEMLERLLQAAVENNTSVSVCGYEETTEGSLQILGQPQAPMIWAPEEYYCKHPVNATIACGKLYRKKCFLEIRYPVGKIHEDEFTTYRILFRLNKIAVIRSKLYYYFQNPDGITKSNWNIKRLDVLEALQEQREYFRRNDFLNAYARSVRVFFPIACGHVYEIRKENTLSVCQKKQYEKKIKRQLRRAYWKYRNILRLSLNKDEWIYNVIFPNFARLYRIANRVFTRKKPE